MGSFAVALVVIMGVFATAIYLVEASVRDRDLAERSGAVARLFALKLAKDGNLMRAVGRAIMGNAAIEEAFRKGDPQDLERQGRALFETLRTDHRITHLYFTGTDRINLYRFHSPTARGDEIDRVTMLQAQDRKQPAQGLELGSMGTLTLRLVMPWGPRDHELGYIEIGEEIEHLIDEVHDALAVDLLVLVDKRYLAQQQWQQGQAMMQRQGDWQRFSSHVAQAQTAARLPAALDDRALTRLLAGSAVELKDGDRALHVALVPLADLVSFERTTSPSEINRRDLARQVVISANLDNLPLGTAGQKAMEVAEKLHFDPGYKVLMAGDTEIMMESFGYMAEALFLAIVFVYLILAAQFESFIDPLAIMLSLPLSIVGMAGTLWLTGDTINIMSLIGLIMLMGLVTKNAILLIDYTKVLRGRGLERREAIITAGRTRLRPILMTTTAMIFGMLPLFLGLGEGAEFRAPMARAVVGGLITSTLLTLIVVPVVYTILDDVSVWLLSRRRHVAAVGRAAVSLAIIAAVGAVPARAQQYDAAASTAPARSLAVQVEQAAKAAAPAGVKVLTLDQALAIAAAQNRDIQKAIEYKNWVEGRYVQERSAALPQGTFAAAFTRTYDDTTSKLFSGFMGGDTGSSGDTPNLGEIFGGRQDVTSASVGVKQVVFTWGQVGAAIRAAKLGFEYSDQQVRRFRQAVVKDVTSAFYNVLAARELVRIAEDNLAQRARRLDEVTKRREAGTATDYDVLASQVELDSGRPAVIRTQNAVRAAREQLRFLLAEPQEVDVEGALAAPIDPVPSYDELLGKALQFRPELGEIHMQQGIYTELIKIAAAGNKPRVDFAATWGKRHLGLPTISSTGTSWNAGIFATVPIFDGWKTKGQVAQVRSERASIDIDELKLREGITLEVRTAVDDAKVAVALLDALTGPVKQAEQLLFLAEKGFELGVKTRLEVQDAEQNVNAARANLAVAQRDYRLARVNLDWVAGVLDGGLAVPPTPAR